MQPAADVGHDDPVLPPAKVPRLADDRVAQVPVGANVVEVDGKSCTHEVAWPPEQQAGCELPPPRPEGPPAREYPFKLDPFQQTAINCLEAGGCLAGPGKAPAEGCSGWGHVHDYVLPQLQSVCGRGCSISLMPRAGIPYACRSCSVAAAHTSAGMYACRGSSTLPHACRSLGACGGSHVSWQDRGGGVCICHGAPVGG